MEGILHVLEEISVFIFTLTEYRSNYSSEMSLALCDSSLNHNVCGMSNLCLERNKLLCYFTQPWILFLSCKSLNSCACQDRLKAVMGQERPRYNCRMNIK
jgi:hypothetical protein